MDAPAPAAFPGPMSKASDAFDPLEAIPRSHALTPHAMRVNEERVARGFLPKLRKVAARLPFAAELVSLWYCARDPDTPAAAKAMMMAALAYFVLPTDVIPDVLVGIGFTDDAAVVAAVLALVGRNLQPRHRQAARELLDRLAQDARDA